MEIRIECKDLWKRYDRHWVLKKFTKTFHSGQIYGIAGSNGIGKSTLVKILSGFLSPSKGSITFFNSNEKIEDDVIYKHIALAAPYAESIEELSVKEAFNFQKQFKSMQVDLAHFLEQFNLTTYENELIKNLSSGTKHRLKLALCLSSNASIIFLDEPASNLDEHSIKLVQSAIKEMKKERLIFIASNIQAEFDLCDELIHMDQS